MSNKSVTANVIVEHAGQVVFDYSKISGKPPRDLHQVKAIIEQDHGLAASTQLLQLESTLLPHQIKIEDLCFKFSVAVSANSGATKRLNGLIKLTLTQSKSQANLKVNIIQNKRDPLTVNLVVDSAISITQLRNQIMSKLPDEIQGRDRVEVVMSLKKKTLDDSKYLFETLYEQFNSEEVEHDNRNQRVNQASVKRANQVDRQLMQYAKQHGHFKTIKIEAFLKYHDNKRQSSMMSLCIDFRFNLLHYIKKVNWRADNRWYRTVHIGLNWFGYCKNRQCQVYNELFVVNRGYGIFKLEQELAEFSCLLCNEKYFDLCNMGFVNCQWALKGQLSARSRSNIYAEGQTYDQKLYTFDEINYKREFMSLNIFVKRHDGSELSNSDGGLEIEKSQSSDNSSKKEESLVALADAAQQQNQNIIGAAAADAALEVASCNKVESAASDKKSQSLRGQVGQLSAPEEQKAPVVHQPKHAEPPNQQRKSQKLLKGFPARLEQQNEAPKKNALEEYRQLVKEKSQKYNLPQLDLANMPHDNVDSIVDMAHRSNQSQLPNDDLFQEDNSPAQEQAYTSSWLSWIPSMWCCSSQPPAVQQQTNKYHVGSMLNTPVRNRLAQYKQR